ncbi:MAG: Mu transposase C-terminal domain-containing protein [Acetobacteraceae bacterium]
MEIYLPRQHRNLNDSPLRMFKASAAATGIVPPPDAVKLLAILSPLYERTVQAYGIDILGLKYNSDELMEYKQVDIRRKVVQANVSPDDVTQAWWVDPRDGSPKSMFMAYGDRKRYRGWTMERHERVRALQRNNPELLAGDAGARRAHAMYLKEIFEAAGSSGLKNRLKAIRALEKLRQRGKAMFNDDYEEIPVEEGEILDGVFGEAGGDAAPTSGAVASIPFDHPDNAFPVFPVDMPAVEQVSVTEVPRWEKRVRKPKKNDVTPAAVEEKPIDTVQAGAAADADSMRAFAAQLVAKSRKVDR